MCMGDPYALYHKVVYVYIYKKNIHPLYKEFKQFISYCYILMWNHFLSERVIFHLENQPRRYLVSMAKLNHNTTELKEENYKTESH